MKSKNDVFQKVRKIASWLSIASVPAVVFATVPNTYADTNVGSSGPVSSSGLHGHAPGDSHGKIQHVVYIIMDNVHYSDIQQMPAVVKFLKQGTVLANDHTVLDSHTQDGMLSDMTGKYPSKTGVIDQGFYENGKYASFAYWAAKDSDGHPHVTATPNWIAFNQHGWSVGAVGAPDMELEKTSEVKQFAKMNPNDSKQSDYLGVSVHASNGQTTFGSPNLAYIYQAKSWADSSKTLGGFPGWGDNTGLNWSLQATYEMQTHGVPVTFTYLHDAHEVNGKQALPGTYGSTLTSYNQALQTFFTKLNQAGMNPSNTLFVLTTDEGDHLMPKGELSTNLTGWLTGSVNSLYQSNANNLNIYGDSGALVYLKNEQTLPNTLASLSAVPGWNYVADKTELQALHMNVTAAPDRNPSFVLFAKPDVYYGYKGSTTWSHNANYLWNHGTISPDILHIWAGMVGPGVKVGQTSNQWVDHADIQPTIYDLLGYHLQTQGFDGVPAISAFASGQRHGGPRIRSAESVFKQLNAPVGKFGMATLKVSTEAAVNATNSEGQRLNQEVATWTQKRDLIAKSLQSDIFQYLSGNPVSANKLKKDIASGQALLAAVTSATAN